MSSHASSGNDYIISFCRKGKNSYICFKDTQREKSPSNKAPALTSSMNMDIWVVAISNQLFIRGSYTEKIFSKK